MSIILLGFISFPLFTRILSVEQYGLLNLVTSLLFVGCAVGKMGLTQAVQRFHVENAQPDAPNSFQRYFSTLFFGSFGIGLVVVAACLGLLVIVPSRFMGEMGRSLLIMGAILTFIRVLQALVMSLWQTEGKTWAFQGMSFALKALTIIASYVMLRRWEPTARAFLIGMLAVELFLTLLAIASLVRRGILSLSVFDCRFFRTAVTFGVPLMWAELGFLVHDSGDRVLVQYFLGPTALGHYSAAYGIAVYVRDLLEVPITLALFPLCMETWNKHGEQETQTFLSKSLRTFCLASIGLLCALTLVSRDLLIILASRKYESAYTLLPVLMAGLVVASFQVFARIGLLIHRRPSMIFRSILWAIAANTLLNIILLPRIGVMGAAIATLLSFSLQVFLTARESLKYLSVPIDFPAIAKYLVSAAVVVAVGSQIHLGNVWAELFVRGAVSGGYLALVWTLDLQARQSVRSAVSAATSFIRA
jgi:O-antigen/teichoic acid export membrane protein